MLDKRLLGGERLGTHGELGEKVDAVGAVDKVVGQVLDLGVVPLLDHAHVGVGDLVKVVAAQAHLVLVLLDTAAALGENSRVVGPVTRRRGVVDGGGGDEGAEREGRGGQGGEETHRERVVEASDCCWEMCGGRVGGRERERACGCKKETGFKNSPFLEGTVLFIRSLAFGNWYLDE